MCYNHMCVMYTINSIATLSILSVILITSRRRSRLACVGRGVQGYFRVCTWRERCGPRDAKLSSGLLSRSLGCEGGRQAYGFYIFGIYVYVFYTYYESLILNSSYCTKTHIGGAHCRQVGSLCSQILPLSAQAIIIDLPPGGQPMLLYSASGSRTPIILYYNNIRLSGVILSLYYTTNVL